MTSPIDEFRSIKREIFGRLDDHARESREGIGKLSEKVDQQGRDTRAEIAKLHSRISGVRADVTDVRVQVSALANQGEDHEHRLRKLSPPPEGPASVRAARAVDRVPWSKLIAGIAGLLTASTGLIGGCSMLVDRLADRIEHAERTTLEMGRESMSIVADTAEAQARASKAAASFDIDEAEEAAAAAERAKQRAVKARRKFERMGVADASAAEGT